MKLLKFNKIAKTCFFLILFIIILSIISPVIVSFNPNLINLDQKLIFFSPQHILGTDELGRDIFSRLLYGARISLFVGIISSVISVAIGAVVGLISGYFSGIVDVLISRVTEAFYAIPSVLLSIILMMVLGGGMGALLVALCAFGWIRPARLIRVRVLELKERDFVKTAKSLGMSDFLIILKHVLPNCVGILIISMTLAVPRAIVAEASMSFLGMGVQPPNPSWGMMLNTGKAYFQVMPSLSIYPGLCIILTVMLFNLLGDAISEKN